MTRTQILNHLISARGYKSYLEIGISNPNGNFNHIPLSDKTGVDPRPAAFIAGVICMRSDDFFRHNLRKFDIVFVDGDHHSEQAGRDIQHALAALNDGGAVVIHDALPHAETYTRTEDIPKNCGAWTGDVWKPVLRLFAASPHLCYAVNTDWGVAVIDTKQPRKHSNASEIPSDLNYTDHFGLLAPYRVSPTEFLEMNGRDVPSPTPAE